MPQGIRLGDPTDHGGRFTASGAQHFTFDGIAVVMKGDACSCPKRGHGACTIAEGDPTHPINGLPVACNGYETSCGATLLSALANVGKS